MSAQDLPDKLMGFGSGLYTEIKSFFGSPVFFIVLGVAFLVAAYELMESTHPSFVFLLAILGVSIVLYGTGTHATGSAEIKNIPAKVYVAGGAGALAAIFGFGVASQSKNIQDVFKTEHQFGVVVLQNSSNQLFDLTRLWISVRSHDGRELHALARESSLEILIPMTSFSPKSPVCVTVTNPGGKSMTARDPCPEVVWGTDSDHSFGELVSRVGKGTLPLVAPKASQLDEQSRPVEHFDYVPQ
jgi:hypothetical protein